MHDQVYDLLVKEDEISWKSILLDLIRKEGMDPWNIDVTIITQRYIERIKSMKEQDLTLSGKVLLAAAILLNIKGKRLVGEDLNDFDRLFVSPEDEGEFYDDDEQYNGEMSGDSGEEAGEETPSLIPHTPLPRKRKVSVFDLVKALEKALEVKHRRLVKTSLPEVKMHIPEEQFDIGLVMKRMLLKIKEFFLFKRKSKLYLQDLFTSTEKNDQIRDLLAVLHLATSQHVVLDQKEPFGKVEIIANPNAPKEFEPEKAA